MNQARKWLPLAVSLGFLGSVGLARAVLAPTTWIVDANGGGNFTDIPPAIAAASDGDLILIRAVPLAQYSDFDLDKALTLVGEQGVRAGRAAVTGASGPAVLADMELRSLEMFDCAAAVTLDGLLLDSLGAQTPDGFFAVNVEECTDVRFVDLTVRAQGGYDGDGGLRVVNSRVEVTSSFVKGGRGVDADCLMGYAGEGGHGVYSEGTSRVHTTRSDVRGGRGGDITPVGFCVTGYAGWGGDGALILDDGELIVGAGQFKGGKGGKGLGGLQCGGGGSGAAGAASATMRSSGAEFFRGAGSGSCSPGKAISIPNVQVAPADPTLERLSDPVAGQGSSVTLRVTGNPGAYTRLFLGTQAVVVPKPNTFIELLLVKETTVGLGLIPASGFIDYLLDLGPQTGWLTGTTVYAQAVSSYPGSEQRRTNSVPLVLR